MTLVGESKIRSDASREVVDRIPKADLVDLVERERPFRLEDVAQPFDRSTTTHVRTIAEFYDLFVKVMDAAAEMDGLKYRLSHSKEFPAVMATLPTFSTRVIAVDPYDGTGRREMGPRFMEEIEDPDYPGDIIERLQRRKTNTIQITVWAATSKAVDDLAEWIEDKFYEYLWIFQWAGLSHPIYFMGRKSDTEETVNNQRIYGAPLVFKVVTSKITQRRETALRSVAIKCGLLIDERVRDRVEQES